jgi:cobalamin biosynthesis protein CbiG
LEEKTKRKAENREKAKQEELLAAAVGGMRETAADVEQRALMRGLEEMGPARLALEGLLAWEEKEEKKVEETAEKMEKMNLSD